MWVDDPAIRELNREWLGRDRATDVLSFPMREGRFADRAGNLLGDVVISLETALRTARRRRLPANRIVARLLVHGVLHLLGHDHVQSARRRALMRAEERRLLHLAAGDIAALGVTPLESPRDGLPRRPRAAARSRLRKRRGPRRPNPSR